MKEWWTFDRILWTVEGGFDPVVYVFAGCHERLAVKTTHAVISASYRGIRQAYLW
jgi:hypothetical protein